MTGTNICKTLRAGFVATDRSSVGNCYLGTRGYVKMIGPHIRAYVQEERTLSSSLTLGYSHLLMVLVSFVLGEERRTDRRK
jgi:hypothetical protein